jgi:hypothetical protein
MRGEINNVKRKQQIINFSGLLYGKITPTDLDALIEYKNIGYIFIEIKYSNTELPFGQKLAIERLVKDTNINKKSIGIIAEHYIEDTSKQINASDCVVRKIFDWKNQWRIPKYKNLKETIDSFIKYIDYLL